MGHLLFYRHNLGIADISGNNKDIVSPLEAYSLVEIET